MRQLLKSAPLDFARDPLMQLVREDWIWHGEQLLDGLYCARDDSLVPDWRAALAPHVQHADAILESDAAAIVLFDGPQKVDCDVLGQALPLRIQHGALSSFPFKPPNDSRLANAVNDSVLIMQFGKVERTMLGAFQNTKPGDWFDTSDMTIEQGIAPPRRPGVPDVATLKTTGQKLFEGAYPDAGLRKVRDAVGQVPTRTNWIDMIGPIGRATVFALLAIILVVMVAQSGMSAAGLTYAVVGIIAASIGFGLVRLLAAKRGARPAPTKPRRRQAPATRRPADGIITTIAFVAVIAFVMVSAFTDSTGNLWSALASILIAGAVLGLLSWVGARLGLGGAGSGAEHEAAEAAQSDPVSSREKSRLRLFFEKLLQNSPFTDLALRKYDRRIAELKRLFDEGRVEEALKKGLALGEQPPPDTDVHADAPIAGPGIRERLEIEAARGERTHALAALPIGAREELEALYRAHAEKCIANGDIEHAAFILAELLDDAEAAVKVFADAGRFAVAAQLAQGRRLPPAIFIPLWYRAGDHDRALRLAERHDAYEVLLQSSDESDSDFRNIVRRAWSQRLAAVGNYVTALSVSEPLAETDASIREQRREWMTLGLAAPNFDAEVIARSLKALPYDTEQQVDPPTRATERLMDNTDIEAARQRQRLAELLVTPQFEPSVVTDFREHRLPRIADRLPRALLDDHASFGLLGSSKLLSTLADSGGQTTLAADIRRLPPVKKRKTSPTTQRLIVGPKSGATGVIAAEPMRGGRLLVAQEDGSVRLLDSQNTEIWRDQLWNPLDIISIAPGRLAIVVRDEPSERRLSIVDTETLSHAEIGPLNLQAWAPTAGTLGWLVYVDKQVLNLRLDQLLAPLTGGTVETLEYHWATPITIDGEMRALTHDRDSGDALWLFEKTDRSLERWCVSQDDLRVSYFGLSFSTPPRTPTVSADFGRFELVGKSAQRESLALSFTAPDKAAKPRSTMPRVHVRTGNQRADQFDCLPMEDRTTDEPQYVLISRQGPPSLHLLFKDASDVVMRTSFSGDVTVLRDNVGRMVKLSMEHGDVLHSNVRLTEPRERDRAS